MQKITITRKALYDLVWKESLTSISRKYALTYDGLKKLCKNNNIPIPQNGYWMKLKYNKPVVIENLPSIEQEQSIKLVIRDNDSKINFDQSPYTILCKQIENDSKSPIKVPEKLTKPDILIQNTIELFSKRKKDRYYRNEKLDYVYINVQEANFPRALRIMDTFIKLLRYRGHSFRRDRNNWGPRIVIKDVEFHFQLREVQKRIPPEKPYDSSTFVPTGILLIKIGESYKAIEWKDGNLKLEKQLVKIVAKLELLADKELIWREECRINAIRRAEEEIIRKDYEARKEKELTKTKRFFSDAEKYNKATIYRKFIKATEQKAVMENNLTDELKDWLKWANEKADWFDPTIRKKDELLNDNDINEILNPRQTNYYYR